jgi:hypothetical protein
MKFSCCSAIAGIPHGGKLRPVQLLCARARAARASFGAFNAFHGFALAQILALK